MQYGSLKPHGYLPRIHDRLLSRLLGAFGAVEVAGTMWCGKTWTSLAFGESVTRVGRGTVRLTAEADASTALLGVAPHVIDEWQDVPAIWDAVREAVDERAGERGLYILTGSSSPAKDKVSHNGAGRIARMRVRTMSLQESGDSSAAVSLAGLFAGSFKPVLVQQRLAPLAEIICRGGWPALIGASAEEAALYLDSYFDALFGVSIPRRGLDGGKARAVALSLARNLGCATKLETIAADAFGNAAVNKAAAHIAALQAFYVIEPLAGWDAPVRAKSRVRTKPKRCFADSSLAANLLQVSPARLLEDGQLFGVLFENLCLHDLAVYVQSLPGAPAEPLRYYRDSDGLEVDAVIELRDGRWAPIEVKLGENKVPEAIESLNRLRAKVAANPAARNPRPAFAAVLVGAGESARYDAANDVYIIPLTALGA